MPDVTHRCQFCRKNFSRPDTLKRHFTKCPKRGQDPIPRSQRARGRQRHACSRCSAKKLSCDSLLPCSSCVKAEVDCIRETGTASHSTRTASHSTLLSKEPTSVLRNSSSIPFLLCADEQDVFSTRFNFPRPAPSTARTDRQATLGENETLGGFLLTSPLEFNFDHVDSLFSYYLAEEFVTPWTILDTSDDLSFTDAEHTILGDMITCLLACPTALELSTEERLFVQVTLEDLLMPMRVQQFLGYYWNHWHRNCRFVHQPSFNASTADKPLLAAMLCIGATYSPHQTERASASVVLPHLESWIFSLLQSEEGNSAETESGSLDGLAAIDRVTILQAGLLAVVMMFWTGGPRLQHRASTHRFGQIACIARRSGLLRAAHTLEDRRSETTWLDNEIKIRTVQYLILVDCAFLFFRGVPLRIVTSEIECDLPCIDTVFDAAHPFSEPAFVFRRTCPTMLSFQKLFDEKADHVSELSLTMLDTFIMIHVMYRYVNDVLVLQLCHPGGPSGRSHLHRELRRNAVTALDIWHGLWSDLKNSKEWEDHGFWRNGDQYEMAIRLLLSENARPELHTLLRADVHRLDFLKALNARAGQQHRDQVENSQSHPSHPDSIDTDRRSTLSAGT